MVVGHNPTAHALSQGLLSSRDKEGLACHATRASHVRARGLRLPCRRWADVAAGSANLVTVIIPPYGGSRRGSGQRTQYGGVALAAPAAQRHAAADVPRRRSSSSAASVTRVPDMPTGCPSAMAPPFTLILFLSRPRSSAEARPTAAKASLISKRSMAPTSTPALPAALTIFLKK